MTSPTPDEQRRLLAQMPGDVGVALRLIDAFIVGDLAGAQAAVDDIARTDRGLNSVSTLAMVCCRLGFTLADRVGGDAASWIYGVGTCILDEVEQVAKRHQDDQ